MMLPPPGKEEKARIARSLQTITQTHTSRYNVHLYGPAHLEHDVVARIEGRELLHPCYELVDAPLMTD